MMIKKVEIKHVCTGKNNEVLDLDLSELNSYCLVCCSISSLFLVNQDFDIHSHLMASNLFHRNGDP